MSLTPLNGSFGASTIYDASPFLASVALNNSHVDSDDGISSSNGPRVFVVVEKPLGYILGEQLRNLVEFIYSRLPSFSFPGAAASSIESDSDQFFSEDQCALIDRESTPFHCQMPVGSYIESCHNRTITYHKDEDECHFQAFCSTVIPLIPPVRNEIIFEPRNLLMLGNNNGTITIQGGSKISRLSSEEANSKLSRNYNALKAIEEELAVSSGDKARQIELESSKEKLNKKQAEIIGRLMPGHVVTFDANGQPLVITSENKADHMHSYFSETFDSFQSLAESTGGIMGLSRSPKQIPYVLGTLFQHIRYSIDPDKGVDIAFVLDTTDSMSDDIELVKENLLGIIGQLKLDKANVRIGLLEYRDSADTFLNRVVIDFTTDLDEVGAAIKKISAGGGGDLPEAVFDALLVTKDQFSWDQKMKHVAILIGDAPPHSKTVDQLYGKEEVIQEYRAKEIEISIYPVVTNK